MLFNDFTEFDRLNVIHFSISLLKWFYIFITQTVQSMVPGFTDVLPLFDKSLRQGCFNTAAVICLKGLKSSTWQKIRKSYLYIFN